MSRSQFGLSVYVSVFNEQKELLEELKGQSTPIFTSLHISEEMTDSYVHDVEEMCKWLYENKFWVMADVSPVTLEVFGEDTLASLAYRLHLDSLRLDFGFDLDEMKQMDLDVNLSYNASTILGEAQVKENAMYMHNFYPRPETGLDQEFFSSLNESIQEYNGKILAFIAGDCRKRGPLYEGLPTLEHHRFLAPYTQFVELVREFSVDKVFLGDISLSLFELDLIQSYLAEPIIQIPVELTDDTADLLYDKKFTVRVDSPKTLIRVQESREYAQQGPPIDKKNTLQREKGSITMDNKKYKRYSGEVQITKKDYPSDERVNVIGHIEEKYLPLLDQLVNGEKFKLIPIKR